MHDYVRAESLTTRAVRVGPVAPVHYENLAEAQVARGKLAAASVTLATCTKSFPRNSTCPALELLVQWNRRQFDSVGARLAALEPQIADPAMHARAVVDFLVSPGANYIAGQVIAVDGSVSA